MIIRLLKLAFFLLIGISFYSCREQKDPEEEIQKVNVKVDIERLEQKLFACKTKESLLNFLTDNKLVAERYFQTPPEGFNELADKLLLLVNNEGLQAFYKQSQLKAFFGNGNLENDFHEAFQHLKYYYPEFKEPKIYTIFSGFGGVGAFPATHLYVSDSVIVIGLDYFMGKNAKFLPTEVFSYQLRRLNPQTVVPQAILLLSANYNATNPNDKTLLSEMVWYGKSYVFGQTMLPSKSDSLFIGYTAEQLNESYAFQQDIWAHFIDNKLLYNTQEPIKGKYIGERPATPEIGSRCPGSIGRWLGYRIVSKYFEEDEKLTIQELMKNPNAQKIFEASKYKGLPDAE